MPKTWEPSKRGIRDLKRHVRKGTVVYTISTQSTRMAPWEDPEMWTEHEFTWRSPVTRDWMTGHLDAQGLLAQFGTVYEEPPRGMRRLGSPGRQVAGPVPQDYTAYLDEAEIRGLEKRLRDASDRTTRRF